jgi:hypothetical protein
VIYLICLFCKRRWPSTSAKLRSPKKPAQGRPDDPHFGVGSCRPIEAPADARHNLIEGLRTQNAPENTETDHTGRFLRLIHPNASPRSARAKSDAMYRSPDVPSSVCLLRRIGSSQICITKERGNCFGELFRFFNKREVATLLKLDQAHEW